VPDFVDAVMFLESVSLSPVHMDKVPVTDQGLESPSETPP
jgi:hypothetical protein